MKDLPPDQIGIVPVLSKLYEVFALPSIAFIPEPRSVLSLGSTEI